MVESFKALSYKPEINLFPQKTVGDVFLISVILCKLTVFCSWSFVEYCSIVVESPYICAKHSVLKSAINTIYGVGAEG